MDCPANYATVSLVGFSMGFCSFFLQVHWPSIQVDVCRMLDLSYGMLDDSIPLLPSLLGEAFATLCARLFLLCGHKQSLGCLSLFAFIDKLSAFYLFVHIISTVKAFEMDVPNESWLCSRRMQHDGRVTQCAPCVRGPASRVTACGNVYMHRQSYKTCKQHKHTHTHTHTHTNTHTCVPVASPHHRRIIASMRCSPRPRA